MSDPTLTQVEQLAKRLPPGEQLQLVERLVHDLRVGERRPVDLYGAWRDRFPPSFDAEAELADIRAGWQRGTDA